MLVGAVCVEREGETWVNMWDPLLERINAESSPIKVEDFTIIIGIAGNITGQLIFGFKEDVVKIIAEKMM